MVLGHANISCHLVAWYLRCSETTVRRWGFGVEATCQLLDKKRPGKKSELTEAMCLKLIAFYCQNPLGGLRIWSLSYAEIYLKEHPDIIGHTVSRSTIHRILKTHCQRPHLLKYFLHISDPNFIPKMDHLLDLYHNPPPYLFSFDGCTGIQALERIGVPITTKNGTKIEFETKRHGTCDLNAFLEVSTGKVFARCTDNHRQETLAELFAEHIRSQPEDATLHYVLDNLAGHSTQVLCETVAALAGVAPPPASSKADERKEWLKSEEKRIVFHFTPYHGSWLNMVEICFGIFKSKCIKGRSFRSVEDLCETIMAFWASWNKYFAHPFRWTYDGSGLIEKVVCRFTSWLLLEMKEMNCGFILKQLLLMTNLVTDYWKQAPAKRWDDLLSALGDHEEYIKLVINSNKVKLEEPKAESEENPKSEPEEAPTNKRKEAGRKIRIENARKKRAKTKETLDVLITLIAEKIAAKAEAA